MWTDHRTGSKVEEEGGGRERVRVCERKAWIWERTGAIEGDVWTLRIRKPSEEIFEQATSKEKEKQKPAHIKRKRKSKSNWIVELFSIRVEASSIKANMGAMKRTSSKSRSQCKSELECKSATWNLVESSALESFSLYVKSIYVLSPCVHETHTLPSSVLDSARRPTRWSWLYPTRVLHPLVHGHTSFMYFMFLHLVRTLPATVTAIKTINNTDQKGGSKSIAPTSSTHLATRALFPWQLSHCTDARCGGIFLGRETLCSTRIRGWRGWWWVVSSGDGFTGFF